MTLGQKNCYFKIAFIDFYLEIDNLLLYQCFRAWCHKTFRLKKYIIN